VFTFGDVQSSAWHTFRKSRGTARASADGQIARFTSPNCRFGLVVTAPWPRDRVFRARDPAANVTRNVPLISQFYYSSRRTQVKLHGDVPLIARLVFPTSAVVPRLSVNFFAYSIILVIIIILVHYSFAVRAVCGHRNAQRQCSAVTSPSVAAALLFTLSSFSPAVGNSSEAPGSRRGTVPAEILAR